MLLEPKKIFSSIGIVAGVIIIILGMCTLPLGITPDSTEEYIAVAGGWLLIALGLADIAYFGIKAAEAYDESPVMPSKSRPHSTKQGDTKISQYLEDRM